eukprot:6237827-Lingulodinium_polyedra.AAC.1
MDFLLAPNEQYDPMFAATVGVLKSVARLLFSHAVDVALFFSFFFGGGSLAAKAAAGRLNWACFWGPTAA